MTSTTKNNIKSFLPYLAFLPSFYMIFAWGQYTEENKARLFDSPKQKEVTVLHAKMNSNIYKSVHMQLKEKEDHFVTRREYDATLIFIKAALLRIENKK